MLYDIRKGAWSKTICERFDIPMNMLPEVKDCAADFGTTQADILGAAVPILGVAGFKPGMLKSTYGTGCFALLNTGDTLVRSDKRMLGTIAYQLDGKTTYARETQALAERADPGQELYLVPAFTGLGAPHWDANARGAIYGLTRGSGPAAFAKAALESVGYQTRDLFILIKRDSLKIGR